MMNICKKSDNRGFSLVEVLIAMAVLAVISLPLLRYFSDSLKNSHLMSVKQGATAMAQQTVEDLKSVERLVDIPDGGTEYSAPYLEGKGFTVVSNSLAADGKGRLELQKLGDDSGEPYDVYVNLTTDVEANAVERPIIYGIDDTQDVLAVEREQYAEALMYFMAINQAHILQLMMDLPTTSPDADPTDPPDWLIPLEEDQVEALMSREIIVEIDFLPDITGIDCYAIKVYYEYKCENLRLEEDVDATEDYMTSSYLADVRSQSLSGIYLLYDRVDPTIAGVETDLITVKKTAAVPLTKIPELLPICQNLQPDNSAYVLLIDMPSDYQMPVRSNILTDTAASPPVNNGHITTPSGFDITTSALTGTGAPVRIVEVETLVYEKGGKDAGKDPYITLNTTKGE